MHTSRLLLSIIMTIFRGGSSSGEVRFSRDAPHTITTWMTSTMCISPALGVGLSPLAELKVFQPFFLEVIAPNVVKRKEIVHLHVKLFSYLNYSVPVSRGPVILFSTTPIRQ